MSRSQNFYFLNKGLTSSHRKPHFEKWLLELPSKPLIQWIEMKSPEENPLFKLVPSPSRGDLCLMDREDSQSWVRQFSSWPTPLRKLNQFDVAFFEDGQWVPYCFWVQAVWDLMMEVHPSLNTRQEAFVCGPLHSIFTSTDFLARLGYKKITLVENDKQSLAQARTQLREFYFDIDFQILPLAKLSTKSNTASIVVNEFPLSTEPILVESLSYLNFVASEGLVADLSVCQTDHQLREEARNVRLPVLKGEDVIRRADELIWKKWIERKRE